MTIYLEPKSEQLQATPVSINTFKMSIHFLRSDSDNFLEKYYFVVVSSNLIQIEHLIPGWRSITRGSVRENTDVFMRKLMMLQVHVKIAVASVYITIIYILQATLPRLPANRHISMQLHYTDAIPDECSLKAVLNDDIASLPVHFGVEVRNAAAQVVPVLAGPAVLAAPVAHVDVAVEQLYEEADDVNVFRVKEITDVSVGKHNGKPVLLYTIWWEGYPKEQSSKERAEDLSADLIQQFIDANPGPYRACCANIDRMKAAASSRKRKASSIAPNFE